MLFRSVKKDLLYLLTYIRFPTEGESVTCRGIKLTNSPGRTKLANSLNYGNNDLNFGLAHDQVVLLETAANLLCQADSSK